MRIAVADVEHNGNLAFRALVAGVDVGVAIATIPSTATVKFDENQQNRDAVVR